MQEARTRYSAVSIVLHWAIFLLIFANVIFADWMEHAEGPSGLEYFQLHKTVGIAVLTLSLFRLVWRFTHPWPPLPEGMPGWERVLARGTHVAFYVLMIAVPLLGWAAASAAGAPGLNLPMAESRELAKSLGGLHKLMVTAIYVVLALHVAGALKHHFLDKDEVLSRMLPLFRPRR